MGSDVVEEKLDKKFPISSMVEPLDDLTVIWRVIGYDKGRLIIQPSCHGGAKSVYAGRVKRVG